MLAGSEKDHGSAKEARRGCLRRLLPSASQTPTRLEEAAVLG